MPSKAPGLDTEVTRLSGVGARTALLLEKLGIYTVQDLLFHLPIRYQDRTRITPIGATLPGQECLVQGEIELTQVKFGRRRSLLCRISDGSGALTLRFFYFNKAQQNSLQRGRPIRCYGRISSSGSAHEMIHPEYRLLVNPADEEVDDTLVPVYPATEGLHQNRLRKLTDTALRLISKQPSRLLELIPAPVRERYDLPDLCDALHYTHRPPPDADTTLLLAGKHPAQQRLAFEELLSMFLSLRRIRERVRKHSARPLGCGQALQRRFIDALAFTLTGAQCRVLAEIEQDLARELPMMRLIQGDVGCGKTVVAALACLNAIASGFQVAVMAPTELLCDQHYRNFSHWFAPLGIDTVILSGKLRKAERQSALQALATDTPLVVVGTHALFQKEVSFAQLGLVIIDEQHRFGVHQRLTLLKKGARGDVYPHQLIMTATPIPRTLTMSAYADLDVSIIDELPPGRKPVNTVVISNQRREDIVERIREAVKDGRQIYWVCTLIEESEALQCQAATETHDYLVQALPGLHVGLIHGRMPDRDKESVMQAYKAGDIDLLVATTVIEVGVDVPNASLMIIENAERLGLAQLHQLRGRIGRGSSHSDCVLMYRPPLSELSRQRLETMRSTSDGFKIAEKDLQLRGPGELIGTRQAGLPQLHIADLVRDAHLLPEINRVADQVAEQFPEQSRQLIARWQQKKMAYGNV